MKRRRTLAIAGVTALVSLVTLAAPAVAQDGPITVDQIPWEQVMNVDPIEAFSRLGFDDPEQRLMMFLANDASDAPEYRYGDDTAGEPTLDLPGTHFHYLTAAEAVLPPEIVSGWPANGTMMDGALYLQAGSGPVSGPMVFFASVFDDVFPYQDPTPVISTGAVVSFPGAPEWQSSFPGDTWWGGFRMPTADFSQPAGWTVNVIEFGPPQSFTPAPMDSVAVIDGNTLIVGVDADDLASGGYDVADLAYGFHLHVADQNMGATPDSESIVSAYPFPTNRTYEDFLRIPLSEPILAGTLAPPAPPPSSTTSSSTTSTTAQAAPEATDNETQAPEAAALPDENPSSLIPWLLLVAGLGLFGGGAATFARSRKPATATEVVEDAGDLFVGGIMQVGTTDVTKLDSAWASLIKREESLQRRLKNQWVRARNDLLGAFRDYEKAMTRFKENAVGVMSATTIFDKLIAQGSENVNTMKTVDFVWGVGQLGLAGVRAAIARFAKTPPTVPWATADEVAEAAGAVRTPPGWVEGFRRSADAMDQAILGRLADEAGVDLAQFLARFENAEEAGKALVSAAAQARGWLPLSSDAQGVIRRLLDAGLTKLGNPGANIDPGDLAQLVKWADEIPDFWSKLARAADWLETAGWHRQVDQALRVADRWGARITETLELLYSSDDISYLRALAERARTGWKPPVVPDVPSSLTGIGRLPRQNVPGIPPAQPSAPTVIETAGTGAPTVIGDSWAELPTVLNRAPGPPTAPTVPSTPTVLGNSWADAPTVLSAPRGGTPTVVGSHWEDAPTVLSGPRGVGPPTAPTFIDGPVSTLGGGASRAASTAGGPSQIPPAVAGAESGWGGPGFTLTEPGTGYLNGCDAFNTVIGTEKTASWLANPASDTPMTLAGTARFNGIDPDMLWAANPADPLPIDALLAGIGRREQWHQLPPDVGILCDTALSECKSAIASGSGGTLDPGHLADLTRLCSADDFPHWLSTAYVDLPEAVVFPYCGDDAVLLETLCSVDGDYSACGEAIGPVWQSAIECTDLSPPSATSPFAGTFPDPSGPITATPLFRPVGKAERAKYERGVLDAFRNSTTSAYIGLEQVPKMFGNLDERTSEFHFAFWTFENSYLASGWLAFSSPFETMTAAYYSGRASKELVGLMQTHGDQLDAMSGAFRDAGRAIDRIEGILGGLAAADGLVGGRAESQLEEFIDGYEDLFNKSPAAWQETHRKELDARRSHIRQKQYQLVRALRPIRSAIESLPRVQQWLESLRHPGSSQLELVNPEVWVRLGAVAMQINGMLAEAFMSGARPVHPPPKRVPSPKKFDWDKAAKDMEEMKKRRKTMPKAEFERWFVDKYGFAPMDM